MVTEENEILGTTPIEKTELSKDVTSDQGIKLDTYRKIISEPSQSTFTSTQFTTPSQPLKKYQKRVGETKFTGGINMPEELAQDQSVGERLAYLLPRAATKAVSVVVSTPGYISGLADWMDTGFDSNYFGESFNNSWLRAVDNAEEDVKSLLPVYTPQSVVEGGLWKNLGSSSFWATEGADGVGFLIGMLAPGAGLRAAKLGINAQKLLKPGLELSTKLAGQIDDIGSVIVNTGFEATTEGRDAYQTTMDETGNKELAGRAAANTFKSNLAILIGPNILQQKWLFNGFNRGKSAANKALNRVLTETGAIAETPTALTTMQRLGKVGKTLGVGVLSEGFFEEGMQNVVAEVSKKGMNPLLNLDEVASTYLESVLGSDQQSTDFWKSVVLGGLLGGGMATVGGVRELKAEDKLVNAYHGILKDNYLRRLSTIKDIAVMENGKPKTDPKTGEYIIDKEKMTKAAQDVLSEAKLTNFMNTLKANGEEEAYEYFKTIQDNRYIMPYVQMEGGLELFKKHVEYMAKQEAKQDVEENGVATTTVEDIKNDLLQKAESLQKIYDEVSTKSDITLDNTIKYTSDQKDIFNEFKKEIKEAKISAKITADFTKNRIDKLRSKLAKSGVISSEAKLDQKLIDSLNNSLEEVKKTRTVDPQEEDQIKSDIKSIEDHIATNKKANEKLKKLYGQKNNQEAFNGMLLDKEKAKAFEAQKTSMGKGLVKIKTPDGDVYGMVDSQTSTGDLSLKIVNKTDKGFEESETRAYLNKNGRFRANGKTYDINLINDVKTVPMPTEDQFKRSVSTILNQKLYDKELSNEALVENKFSNAFIDEEGITKKYEETAKHEFDGTINSFLYAAMDQSQATDNDDVARWFVFVNNYASELENGKNKYSLIAVSKQSAESLPFKDKLTFFDDNDIKLVVVRAGTTNPLMVDAFGNVDPKGEFFVTSSMLLPKTTFTRKDVPDQERFSYANLEATYKKNNPSKSEDEVKKFVEKKVEKALEDYTRLRESIKASKDVYPLNIFRVTSGVKNKIDAVDTDVLDAVESSFNVAEADFVIDKSKVNSSTGDATDEVVEHKSNNNTFGFRRGFLYMNYKNRWELVKPKTLSQSEELDNILGLFKYVAIHLGKTEDGKLTVDAERAGHIKKYLNNVLYHNASPNSGYSNQYRLFFYTKSIEEVVHTGLVFGNKSVSFDALLEEENINALRSFLSEKYWNFNWNLLDKNKNSKFTEFRAVEENGKIKIEEKQHKNYRHFLFSQDNKSKGLINIKPAPKGENGRYLLAKDGQYSNQGLQFVIPGKVENKINKQEQEKVEISEKEHNVLDERFKLVEIKLPEGNRYLLYNKEKAAFASVPYSELKDFVDELGIKDKLILTKEEAVPVLALLRNPDKTPKITESGVIDDIAVNFYEGEINLPETEVVKDVVLPKENEWNSEDPANNRFHIEAKKRLPNGTPEELEEKARDLYNHSKVRIANTAVRTIERKINDLEKYEQENIEQARKWLSERFPEFPVDVINGIINSNAWGAVTSSGRILLSDIAESGTAYHEAWHTFNLFFTSKEDREALYSEVRDRIGNKKLSDKECEEILAEEFRDFMMEGNAYKFNKINEQKKESIFRRILNWLKKLFGVSEDPRKIEKAFVKLREGSFIDIVSRPEDNFFSRIKGIPAINAQAYLEDINAKFFDYIFDNLQEGKDVIMHLDVKAEDIYDTIKFGYEDNNVSGEFTELLAFWDQLLAKHRVFMTQYKVDLRDAIDEDDILGRNNDFVDSASKDLKDEVPSPIRLLIGSIPETELINGVVQAKVNKTFGTSSNVQFDRLMNLIENRVAKAGSESDFYNKLGSVSDAYPSIKKILRVLGFESTSTGVTDTGNISETQFRLRNQLYHSFANTKTTPILGVKQHDGGIVYIYPSSENEKKVVRQDWINTGRALAEKEETPYITKEYTINKDKLIAGINKAMELKRGYQIKSLLADLGMDVNPNDVTTPKDIHYLYIKTLKDELQRKDLGEISLDDLYNGDIIENDKDLVKILEHASRNYINDTDLTYQTIDGNLEYGIARGSHIHEMVDRLNWFINNPNMPIPESIKKIFPLDNTGTGNIFTINSEFIKRMLDSRGSINPLQFEVVKLQGVKDNKDNGVDLNKEEYFDYLMTTFDAILNNINPVLRAGDRGPEYGIKFLPNETVTRDLFKEKMRGYLFDEVFSSMALIIGKYGAEYENYKKNARELRSFKFIHEGKIIPKIEEYLIDEGISDENTLTLEDIRKISDAYIAKYSNELDKIFDRRIDNLIDNNLEELKSWKFIIKKGDVYQIPGLNIRTLNTLNIKIDSKSKTITEEGLNEIMMRHAYNYFVNTQEQLKVFLGDIAFYKDGADFHKRITSLTSTRTKLPNDDSTIENANKFYPNVLGKEHSKNIDAFIFDTIKEKSKLYDTTMKSADGQLWSTMEFARSLKIRQGLWEDGNEITYQYETQKLLLRVLKDPELQEALGKNKDDIKDMFKSGVLSVHTNGSVPSVPMFKGKKIDPKDCEAFPAVKPLGVGPEISNDHLYATSISKMSVAPVIPSLLPNDKLKIYLTLIKNGGDVLGDATTQKGAYISAGKFGEITETTPRNVSLVDDFGIQGDTNKEDKEFITDSSQKRRVLFSDTHNNGKVIEGFEDIQELIKEHKNITKSLTKDQLESLKDSLGISIKNGEYFLEDEELFKNQLINLVESRILPDNVTDSVIQVLESDTKSSEILLTRKQLESILMALPKNRLIKGKVAGEMYVQESGWMYEPLDFYADGKAMEVMVPIPKKWVKWVESIGGIDELNKLILSKKFDSRILTISANRIPTAVLNTLEVLKIKKFLPYYAGSRIILPGDITIKASSDFDIDKLFTYLNNVKMTDDGPRYIEYLTDENSTALERYEIKYKKYRNLQNRIDDIGDKEFQKLLDEDLPIADAIDELFKSKPLSKTLEYWTDEELQEILDEKGKKFNVKKIRHLAKIEEEKSPSFEEFKSFSLEEQNTKKAMENRLNEISIETLLDPKRFESLTRPLTSDNLKSLAVSISRDRSKSKLDILEEESKENTDVLTEYWYNARKYREFQSSKQLVAYVMSAASVNNKLQEHPIPIIDPLFTLFFEGQDKKEGETYSNGFIEDGDGYITTDNYGQFSVAAVDAVKDPFLFHILRSNKLFSLYSFLNKTGITNGVGIKKLSYFLTNPLIEKYLKELSIIGSIGVNNSIYDYEDIPELAKRKSDIINDLLKTFSGNTKLTYDDLLSTAYDNYLYAKTDEEKGLAYTKFNELKRKYNYKYLTLKDLQDPANSIQILDNFLMYQRIAGQEIGMMKVLRPDASNNFPKSFNGIADRVDVIDDTFENNNSIFSSFAIEKYVKDSFLEAFYNMYKESSKLYSWFQYINRDEDRRDALKYVITRLGINPGNPSFRNRNVSDNKDREKVITKIENDLLQYIYMTQKYKGTTPRETSKNQEEVYSRLFTGPDSLPSRYNRLKKAGKISSELAKTIRPVIKEFSATIGKNRENDYLTTFTKKSNVSHENNITDILYDMLESKDTEIRTFAEDMFDFGLMQSGLSGSPISFVKFLPQSYYAKRMDTYIKEFFDNPRYKELLEGFISQFAPVNHQDNLIVPRHDKLAVVRPDGRITIGAGRGLRIEDEEGKIDLFLSRNVGGEYILIRTKANRALYKESKKHGRKVPSDTILFKFVEMKPLTSYEIEAQKNGKKVYRQAVYQRVSKQGDGPRFLEYYTTTGGSLYTILGKNKVKVEKPISTSNIRFKESKGGYAYRTEENAIAGDFTLAIAENFNTLGEIKTKKSVPEGKYIPVDLRNLFKNFYIEAEKVAKILNESIKNSIVLNIAGNGIYSLNVEQDELDRIIYNFIKIVNDLTNNKIKGIITGGQTGVDEAGAKAGIKLGIFVTINAPKDWEFRNKQGQDISKIEPSIKERERLFKERFGITNTEIQQELPFFTWSSTTTRNYQLLNSGISEKNIKELDDTMKDFLSSIGVEYKESNVLRNKFGNEVATAIADLTNMTVEVLEGKTNIQTLPEEAAHFYVHLLDKNSGLYKSMYNNIVNYSIYSKVKEDYKDLYTTEEEFRQEAIGQLIGKKIVNEYVAEDERSKKQVSTWWNVLWNYIKNLFSKRINDPYAKAAYNILNNKIDKLILSKKEGSEMYQLTSIKEGVNDVFKQNPELSNIGTEEQYSQYLDTIFPDSKVKDIVYRGSEKGIDKDTNPYLYFTKNKNEATIYAKTHFTKGGNINERNPIPSIRKNIEKYIDDKYGKNSFKSLITDKQNFYEQLSEENYELRLPDWYKEVELSNEDKSLLKDFQDLKQMYNIVKIESEEDLMKQYDDTEYQETKPKYDKLRNKLNPFFNQEEIGKIELVLLNIQNPYIEEIVQEDLQNNRTAYKNGHDGAFLMDGDHFVVKNRVQIHILGSKQDIEGFKKFVNKPNLSKESNIDELNKESKNLDISKTLSTFDKLFPEESWRTPEEKEAFVQGTYNGDFEIACGI